MLNKYEKKFLGIKESTIEITNGLIVASKFVLESFENCNADKLNVAKEYIKNISNKTGAIDYDIITILALQSPEAGNLRTMVSYLKITNELLRVSSNIRSFIKGFTDICKDVNLSTIKEYAVPMQKSTIESLQYAVDMMSVDCVDEIKELFNKVLIAESKTDDLYKLVEANFLKQNQEVDKFEVYHKMLSALRKSEKIADRAMSIASLLLFAKAGGEIHHN